jgi:hypothetical protein
VANIIEQRSKTEGLSMGFFKDLTKRRVVLDILAGGNILTDKPLGVPIKTATMIETDNHGEVIVQIPFGPKKVFKVDGIEWEESGRRSGGKAAGGAIIGTLVAGPIGTIAGAAIGGRRKDTSKAYVYLIDENEVEHELHIRCDEKKYREINAFM